MAAPDGYPTASGEPDGRNQPVILEGERQFLRGSKKAKGKNSRANEKVLSLMSRGFSFPLTSLPFAFAFLLLPFPFALLLGDLRPLREAAGQADGHRGATAQLAVQGNGAP